MRLIQEMIASKIESPFARGEATIVQCHGYFDLLHYGHLVHLEAAKAAAGAGGVLVVTLTAGRHMTKPGHPIFTDAQRVAMLRALRCVDQVIVIDAPDALAAIERVNPDLYVKGLEYEGVLPELQYCLEHGIEVKFLGPKMFGSTRLAGELA